MILKYSRSIIFSVLFKIEKLNIFTESFSGFSILGYRYVCISLLYFERFVIDKSKLTMI